jgi:hypothetical protein
MAEEISITSSAQFRKEQQQRSRRAAEKYKSFKIVRDWQNRCVKRLLLLRTLSNDSTV